MCNEGGLMMLELLIGCYENYKGMVGEEGGVCVDLFEFENGVFYIQYQKVG